MRLSRILLAGVVLSTGPAVAADYEFGGNAQLRAGYGTNPFLYRGSGNGSALVGFNISPSLERITSRGTTTLSGSYDRNQYFSHYGHADTARISLSQSQQLTSRLSGNASVAYTSSINSFLNGGYGDPDVVDVLTTGQRTRRVSGSAGLSWQLSDRDQLSFTGQASHTSYGNNNNQLFTSGYDDYGGTAQYLRTVSGRTQVGVSVAAQWYDSKSFTDSHSYEPSLVVTQQLSAFWTANGSIGVILQKTDPFAGFPGRSTTSIGFSASACGTYPRYSVCLNASRQSAPSGFGGLRRDLSFGVNGSYKLTSRSTLSGNLIYDKSQGSSQLVGPIFFGQNDRFFTAGLTYDHVIRQRLSGGVSASYQRRNYGNSSNLVGLGRFGSYHATAATVTANLNYRFGRLGGAGTGL